MLGRLSELSRKTASRVSEKNMQTTTAGRTTGSTTARETRFRWPQHKEEKGTRTRALPLERHTAWSRRSSVALITIMPGCCARVKEFFRVFRFERADENSVTARSCPENAPAKHSGHLEIMNANSQEAIGYTPPEELSKKRGKKRCQGSFSSQVLARNVRKRRVAKRALDTFSCAGMGRPPWALSD